VPAPTPRWPRAGRLAGAGTSLPGVAHSDGDGGGYQLRRWSNSKAGMGGGSGSAGRSRSGSAASHSGGRRAGGMRGGAVGSPQWARMSRTVGPPEVRNVDRHDGACRAPGAGDPDPSPGVPTTSHLVRRPKLLPEATEIANETAGRCTSRSVRGTSHLVQSTAEPANTHLRGERKKFVGMDHKGSLRRLDYRMQFASHAAPKEEDITWTL
jgi:hypothetical protein